MANLFSELRRRNVIRVGVAYLIGAWLVVQVADTVLNNIGAPAWFIQATMLLLFLGFLFAVFFAWAFEVTPEGLKRESDVDRSRSVTHVTGRKLDRAITALLVIALGYFIWEARIADRSAPVESTAVVAPADEQEERASIAVLPFDNRSSREEDEYFTEGIHDDLLTTISKIGSMKVISRTSVMEYRDTTKNMREIARELDVKNVLEGGVQRSGNQIRINVQLIDATTDEHLWAEIYDRELTAGNLFAIQSEIAAAIADALHATLSPEEQVQVSTVGTQNLEAYEAYLLGKQQLRARRADSVVESKRQFQRAVDLDPQFALAWVGLSDANRFSVDYGTVDREDAYPEAERAVNTALAIDERLGEGYASRADLKARSDREDEAAEDFKLAIRFAPNYAPAHHWYGILLMRKGRIDEAIAAYQRSIELDPLSASPRTNLAALYEIIGRMDDALQLLERVVVIDPQGIRGQSALAVHYATARGRLDQGVLWASRAVTNDPQNPRFQFYMAVFYMALGDFDTATAWLRALGSLNTDDFRQTRGHLYLAMVQGDAQRAQELANQIFEHYSSGDRDQLYLALVNLRDVDIRAGRFADALARFETLFPELTATQSPDLEAMLVTIIEDLAYLHLHSGNDARARQLLELAIPFTESQPILGRGGSRYGNARAYALLGRNEAALEDLQRGVKAGWRMNWRLVFDYDPILEPLRDEPRFQELRELINADMEEQLESVRQLEASGDVLRPEAFARRSEQNPQGRVR